MKKLLKVMLATATLALTAGAAQAANVHWSVGINLPPIATVISSGPQYGYGPVYAPAPVYAPPVVYRAAPVYYPSPVYYGPPARYYGPPAVVIDRRWGGPRGHWEHRGHDGRGYGRDGGGDGRWDRR